MSKEAQNALFGLMKSDNSLSKKKQHGMFEALHVCPVAPLGTVQPFNPTNFAMDMSKAPGEAPYYLETISLNGSARDGVTNVDYIADGVLMQLLIGNNVADLSVNLDNYGHRFLFTKGCPIQRADLPVNIDYSSGVPVLNFSLAGGGNTFPTTIAVGGNMLFVAMFRFRY